MSLVSSFLSLSLYSAGAVINDPGFVSRKQLRMNVRGLEQKFRRVCWNRVLNFPGCLQVSAVVVGLHPSSQLSYVGRESNPSNTPYCGTLVWMNFECYVNALSNLLYFFIRSLLVYLLYSVIFTSVFRFRGPDLTLKLARKTTRQTL